MKSIKKLLIGVCTLVIASSGVAQVAGATGGETTVGGFTFPETVIHNVSTDRYLVSNTGNAPGAPQTPGFISSVKPNGEVVDYKWIDGASGGFTLNDPLGMAVYAGKLYVADNDYVRVFNVFTGQHLNDIQIPGVSGLNDVTAFLGGVFVSDPGIDFSTNTPTGTDAVYKINGVTNQVSTLVAGPQLANPNGLLYEPGTGLLVAPMTSTTIKKVNISNGQVSNFATLPDVGYDGIAKVGGKFYFSNPPTGNIYRTDTQGNNATLFANYPVFPTNIGSDKLRNRLLIPQLPIGTVTIRQL